jgi:hypothetical protein
MFETLENVYAIEDITLFHKGFQEWDKQYVLT